MHFVIAYSKHRIPIRDVYTRLSEIVGYTEEIEEVVTLE
jgi:hypothetical protein